jgi:acetyltransferase-like isoleucine patch superfamily enzyme
MTVAVVKLNPFLVDQTFFGMTIPEWWVWVCSAAGLEAQLVMDDSDGVGQMRIDGRFLALDPADLADLDEHDGVLVTPTPDEVVVAAGRTSRARLGRRGKGRSRLVTSDEPIAVHDLDTLATAENAARWHTLDEARGRGVRLLDPARTWISPTAVLEPGCTIWPDVVLLGTTVIGTGAVISSGCHLTDTRVGRHALLKPYTVAEGATLHDRVTVGPFAHLRRGTVLHAEAHIGNFVETKNAIIGEAAKAGHLSYLGDCTVGASANIGAGTIPCNYDGARKHTTTIGPGAFIGTHSSLVAPVTVGEGALVAAGSVITKDVPGAALALARGSQVILPGKGAAILKRNRELKAMEPPTPTPSKPRVIMLPPRPRDEPVEEGSDLHLPAVPVATELPTAFGPSLPVEVTEEDA